MPQRASRASSIGSGTPAPTSQPHRIYFLEALSTIPVPRILIEGGVPVEVVAANGKTQPAKLLLSHDKFTLSLFPHDNNNSTSPKSGGGGFFSFGSHHQDTAALRSIDIGEMDRILRGQSTQQFEKAKKKAGAALQKADLLRNSSAGSQHSGGASASKGTSTQGITSPIQSRRTMSISNGSTPSTATSMLLDLDPQRSFSVIFRGMESLDLMVAGPAVAAAAAAVHVGGVEVSYDARNSIDPGIPTSVYVMSNNHQPQNYDGKSPQQLARDELCSVLDSLLNAYQHAKVRVAPEVLLLRYVWLHTVVMDHPNNNRGGRGSNTNRNNSPNNSPNNKLQNYHTTVNHWQKILPEINFVAMRPKDVQSAYDHFGKVIGLDRASRRNRGLTFEQSATFLHKIKRDSWMVKPVQVIWEELFGGVMNNGKLRTTVSEKTFLDKFWRGCQDEQVATLTNVRILFRKLHDMEIAHDTTSHVDLSRITRDQFEAYLFGAENDAFDPQKDKLDISDMNQPLSEYWINSSHNTYLIGDQYKSHSSVEMYSNALYRGCRCLELDIWDGGKSPSGQPKPVVWHGHTLTTKIVFEDTIKTIKVFLNFHHDTFPIILSFENHCSIPYQEVMADQLVRILGDSLYIPTEASLFGKLPSPNQLRGMVVIKGRRPDGTEADAYDTDDDMSDTEDGSNGITSSMGDFSADMEAQRATLRKKHGVAPQLARLTLFHGHKLKSFEQSIRTATYYMHSFSENKVRSHCRHRAAYRWIVHNQTHMSRTYPAGARVDSSNYNPLLAWSMGCQMVALNFQTADNFLRLNDGRFRENGQCGYVLKPSSLMIKEDLSQTTAPVRLSVRVLSGSCLPKPKGQRTGDCIDPYVKVAVFDVVNEERETITTHQTEAVLQNGFFPIWNQAKFNFTVENWSVAMLQVTVYDKSKDEFIASSSIPISCLRRGIRSVKLYDAINTRSGAFDFASLLMEFKIGQVVAEI